MKVLAVGAHPDDIEFGVGGTLLKHKAAGHELHVLVLTQGESGTEIPEIRRTEAEQAAAWLEAGCTIGDLPDTEVGEKPAIDLIEAVAAEFKPDVAYIHSVHDTHQDHRAVAYAARVALRNVRKLWAYQAPSATAEFAPARFPNVDAHIDGKLELIRFHKSQAGVRRGPGRYLEDEHVRATARYWGIRAGGCTYSEPLEVIADRDYSADAF